MIYSQKNIENELEFRIEFKKEFGIDWQEAWGNLQKQKQESERKWNDTLVKHGLK